MPATRPGILVCLLTGATMVPQPVYDPEQAMRLIAAERITILPGAPTIYQTMLDHPARAQHDLSSLRLAVTGAAVVPAALVERMQAELSFDDRADRVRPDGGRRRQHVQAG